MMSPKYIQCLQIAQAVEKSRKRIRLNEYVVLIEKHLNVKWSTAKDYIQAMIRIGVLKDVGEDVQITADGAKYLKKEGPSREGL